jgi:hypothetical protein
MTALPLLTPLPPILAKFICIASFHKEDIKLLLDGYSAKDLNASDFVKLINVEEIDNYRV